MTDYERIEKAIVFITQNVELQPSLDEAAAHVHLSRYHFQRLFSRWAGVTPKRFLQTLTVERAKKLLRTDLPTFEASCSVGLSSGSRLHEHFVQLEAVTPGEYKSGGQRLLIRYAVQATPFGDAFIAQTPRGVCALAFGDASTHGKSLIALKEKWPSAHVEEERKPTARSVQAIFGRSRRAMGPFGSTWLEPTFR